VFWETITEKKKMNQTYSIYEDFPDHETATDKARRECCDFVKNLRSPEQNEGA
jgi:hypothetical protein